MIFSLKHYNDLGRCSFGTLRETVDTEKDEIYLGDKKVEIKNIEDLFPFLWQSPGCWTRNGDHTISKFSVEGTHWHLDFNPSLKRELANVARLEKKIAKEKIPARVGRYRQDIEWSNKHIESICRLLEWHDSMLEEQKKELIEENRKGGR